MSAVQELTDRQAITDLISRLGLWLDEQRFGEATTVLTEDARVDTPGGTTRGIENVAAQARRNHEGHRTQHVITNVLVDLDGDRATAQANLTVSFDGTRTLGERYGFEAVRRPEGWRLASVRVTPVWESATA